MGWWLFNKINGQYENVDTGQLKQSDDFRTRNGFSAPNARRIAVKTEITRTNNNGSTVKTYLNIDKGLMTRPVLAIQNLGQRSINPIGANLVIQYFDSQGEIRYISSGYLNIVGSSINDFLTQLFSRYSFGGINQVTISILSS